MEDHLGQMETQNQQLEDENTPVLGRRNFSGVSMPQPRAPPTRS